MRLRTQSSTTKELAAGWPNATGLLLPQVKLRKRQSQPRRPKMEEQGPPVPEVEATAPTLGKCPAAVAAATAPVSSSRSIPITFKSAAKGRNGGTVALPPPAPAALEDEAVALGVEKPSLAPAALEDETKAVGMDNRGEERVLFSASPQSSYACRARFTQLSPETPCMPPWNRVL